MAYTHATRAQATGRDGICIATCLGGTNVVERDNDQENGNTKEEQHNTLHRELLFFRNTENVQGVSLP